MSDQALDILKQRLGEVTDIHSAIALLQWDQEVYMPPKGATARAMQMATLSALAHRLFTADEVGRLIQGLRDVPGLEEDERGLVREAAHDYARETQLPEAFVREFAETRSAAYEAWVQARAASSFRTFQPHLQKVVDLLRRKADYHGYEGSPYNALLDEYERGMTAEQLQKIFGELAPRQSALVERIAASPNQPRIDWLEQDWDEDKQWQITLHVLKDMGYDLEAGRQDRSVHPFTTNFDIHDVRVTTRINRRELFSGLTGSIHEGGHALYEQGFLESDRRTPLAQSPSLGMHESQSRMWENMIGRSLPFWQHYEPLLRQEYGSQLDGVLVDDLYRAVNCVQPSLIRVEADECTYNLHIILRFELELDLIEERLRVEEIPDAWNAKIKQYLGLEVPDDAHGCLQDIHWSHGAMGYFPTYALGNLYAAQLFEKIYTDIPDLWEQVEEGQFASLLEWLREHVHRHGRRKLAAQIVEEATGAPPSHEPFLRYLQQKYGELYNLDGSA